MYKETGPRLFWKALAILFLVWLFLFLFSNRYLYYQEGTRRINRLTSKLFLLDSESAEWRDIRKQHREEEKKLADEQVEYEALLKRLRSLMTPDEIKSMEDQGLSEYSWLMKTKREKEATEKKADILDQEKDLSWLDKFLDKQHPPGAIQELKKEIAEREKEIKK